MEEDLPKQKSSNSDGLKCVGNKKNRVGNSGVKSKKNHSALSMMMKRRKNTAILTQWMKRNFELRKPTKMEKISLGEQAFMTKLQVDDWFSNTRRVIKKISHPVWCDKHPTHSANPDARAEIQKIYGKNSAIYCINLF